MENNIKNKIVYIIVIIFRWCGRQLFQNRIDYYTNGKLAGVAFSNNLNLTMKHEQIAKDLQEENRS
jgi:hypothetical protein